MLTKDKDKGIAFIGYNNIGLVDSVVFNTGAKITYVYYINNKKAVIKVIKPSDLLK